MREHLAASRRETWASPQVSTRLGIRGDWEGSETAAGMVRHSPSGVLAIKGGTREMASHLTIWVVNV